MLASLLSLLFTLLLLLLLLDHLGSRRLRQYAIRHCKAYFAQAEKQPSDAPRTLRLRYKGAVPHGKHWRPVEGKVFFTRFPFFFLHYADLTGGLFFSIKKLVEIKQEESNWAIRQQLLAFSFIPFGKKKTTTVLPELLFLLPWYPALLKSVYVEWQETDTLQQRQLSLQLGKQQLQASVVLTKNGLIKQIRTEDGAYAGYSQWKDINGQQIATRIHVHNGLTDQPATYELIDHIPDEAFKWW